MSKEVFQFRLGERIKSIRIEKGMSQQELATVCDFEKSNMSRIEAGNTNPTFYTLTKIAIALHVDLKELLDINLD